MWNVVSVSAFVQRLDEIRVLGKLTAVGVEDRQALRQDIGNNAIAGLGDQQIHAAQQVFVVALRIGKNKNVTVLVFVIAGRYKKKLPLRLQLAPG